MNYIAMLPDPQEPAADGPACTLADLQAVPPEEVIINIRLAMRCSISSRIQAGEIIVRHPPWFR